MKLNLSLATQVSEGDAPWVIFCPGFNSSKQGNKALALEASCRQMGRGYVRFDYRGHGESPGDFGDCTIDTWKQDVIAVVDHVPVDDVILIGSSMGGWLALLAALQRPSRVRALLLIACAADMTKYYPERIQGLSLRYDEKRRPFYAVNNTYDDEQDYRLYQALINSGTKHLLLHDTIALTMPIRLIHGVDDEVVEWQRSLKVLKSINSEDVRLDLIKNGDHRLSTEQNLAHIERILKELI